MRAYEASDTEKIMLVGDIAKAFSDADSVSAMGCRLCGNMVDAIDAAATGSYKAIGVVLLGTSGKIASALKALRQANPHARIILLAQMFEEPAAMNLLAGYNGQRIADDYLICPLDIESFFDSALAVGAPVDTTPWKKSRTRYTPGKIQHLEELATTDELTGLKNRRYIWEFARQVIELAKKDNTRVTLLVFDIDDFKHYNDVYGHSAGDDILKQAAVLMGRTCRNHDIVGRIGGDEFAVIFWDDPKKRDAEHTERRSALVDHPKEAIFIANRFRTELKNAKLHLLGEEGRGVLTISGGLASFPRDGANVQQLFEQADKALFEAKRSGKNRIYLVGK
ncbi:GGDEF domain-containing protein [Planctomycetota bacterium]